MEGARHPTEASLSEIQSMSILLHSMAKKFCSLSLGLWVSRRGLIKNLAK
jgi:hypothetical protein